MSVKCLICVFVSCFTCALVQGYYSSEGPQKTATLLNAKVGEHVVFNCELDFPQDIEIPYVLNWNKDGKNIYNSYEGVVTTLEEFAGRISLLDSGFLGYGKASINLTSIRDTDSGCYECRVLFPNRSPITRNNGTWFHLVLEGYTINYKNSGNLIAIPPVNQTSLEEDEARFQCVPKTADAFVKWYKDGEAIVSLGDLSHRSWMEPDGSLVIKPTDMSDRGEYTCEVANSAGERQVAKASLNVQYKAKVIYTPRELYLPYGRPAVLDCHFRANPPLLNLRWEKDGFLFDPYNVPGVYSRHNGSLYFNKVDETHAGQYSCTPFNDLGTKGPSPNINVVVQRPPAFTMTPHNLYLRRLGENITFPCDAIDSDGSHRPTIIWTKDGGPLPEGRYTFDGGNLTINTIDEIDRGLYQCSATNEAAAVTAETELMIENVPPRAPYNLTATASSSSITLTWIPATSRQTFSYPNDGSPQSRSQNEYQVLYRPVDMTEWRTVRVSSVKNTETVISHLNPGKEYELMVLSPDRFGEGMFSKSIKVWTKGAAEASEEEFQSSKAPLGSMAQMGAPRDLSIRLTTDGYLLEWLPPTHGKDLLRIYVVRWSKGQEEYLMGTAETKNTFYIINDLEEDEIYHFQVYALSVNDYQAMSAKVSIHVPAYGRIRAAVAGVACVILLILAGAVFWFSRHRMSKSRKDDGTGSKSKANHGDRS